MQTGAKQYKLLNHAKELFGRVLDNQQHARDNANNIKIQMTEFPSLRTFLTCFSTDINLKT